MRTDILTIMGTRPQYIKCSVMRDAYLKFGLNEILIDTGQHFDDNMSSIFFEQLGLTPPEFTLSFGGLSHSKMLGSMLIKLETYISKINPKCIVVLGDTISTLAGSIAAKHSNIKLIHIESGLRSYDKKMPEEQNRILTDHLSDILFCPTSLSASNLLSEGIKKNVYVYGDIMLDATLKFKNIFKRPFKLPTYLTKKTYDLVTIHRKEALVSKEALLKRIKFVLDSSKDKIPLILLHPNTKNKLNKYKIDISKFFILPPQGYLETQWLLKNANHLYTDSGGLQKEAFFHKIPTTTLRDTTEWPETIRKGRNKIWLENKNNFTLNLEKAPFGNGDASKKIAKHLKSLIQNYK